MEGSSSSSNNNAGCSSSRAGGGLLDELASPRLQLFQMTRELEAAKILLIQTNIELKDQRKKNREQMVALEVRSERLQEMGDDLERARTQLRIQTQDSERVKFELEAKLKGMGKLVRDLEWNFEESKMQNLRLEVARRNSISLMKDKLAKFTALAEQNDEIWREKVARLEVQLQLSSERNKELVEEGLKLNEKLVVVREYISNLMIGREAPPNGTHSGVDGLISNEAAAQDDGEEILPLALAIPANPMASLGIPVEQKRSPNVELHLFLWKLNDGEKRPGIGEEEHGELPSQQSSASVPEPVAHHSQQTQCLERQTSEETVFDPASQEAKDGEETGNAGASASSSSASDK